MTTDLYEGEGGEASRASRPAPAVAQEPSEVTVAKINRSSAITAAVITGVVTLTVGIITAIVTYNVGVQVGSQADNEGNTSAVSSANASSATSRDMPGQERTTKQATTTKVVTPTVTVTPVPQNVISADGVYVVGQDIPPGTYHTRGGSRCYFAKLKSAEIREIIDNDTAQSRKLLADVTTT